MMTGNFYWGACYAVDPAGKDTGEHYCPCMHFEGDENVIKRKNKGHKKETEDSVLK